MSQSLPLFIWAAGIIISMVLYCVIFLKSSSKIYFFYISAVLQTYTHAPIFLQVLCKSSIVDSLFIWWGNFFTEVFSADKRFTVGILIKIKQCTNKCSIDGYWILPSFNAIYRIKMNEPYCICQLKKKCTYLKYCTSEEWKVYFNRA